MRTLASEVLYFLIPIKFTSYQTITKFIVSLYLFNHLIADFEIECEEILLSGDSDDEKTNEVSKPKESVTTAHESTVGSSQSPQVNLNPENLIACEDVEDVPESAHSSPNVSAPSTKSTAASSVPQSSNSSVKENTSASKTSKSELPTKLPPQNDFSKSNSSSTVSKPDATSTKPDPHIPKLHNISTKEDTSDQARQLYSMIQSGSFQNFSVMHPSSKNLVRQLLDIVKLANSKSDASASGEESIPNSYIITTKYDDRESTAKVKLVETDEVISMVNQTVQAIKDGTYEKTDDIVIICGSPAIFLIKNVSVKSFDPTMNSVYVITSENLISYLYILSTQAKPPRKIPAKTTETVAPTVSSAAKSSPQTTPSSIPAKVLPKILPKPLSTPISPLVSNTISPIPSVIAKTSTVSSSSLKISSELVRNHLTAAKAPTLNAAASIAPLAAGTPLQVSTVAGTTPTRPPATTPKSTSAVSSEATLKTSQLVTSISSPIISSHFLATPASIPTVVIPSKSSAFQIPQMIATPIGTIRNNIVTLKHSNTTPKSTKESNSVPLVLAQLPSSAVTSMPTVSNPLTKTNLVKLTLPPSVTVSKSIPAQLLKSSLPTQQPIRATVVNDAGKLSLAFDSLKRKTDDSKGPQSSPKRPAFGENSNKWILPNVTPDVARSPSPEVPSPLGDDNANSDEERPLSPRAAQRRLANQRYEIRSLEQKIIKKERDILALRKKIPVLRKRCSAAKKTSNSKSDEQLVEEILKKYFDNDAVHLFVGQMKVAGKTFTQFRWTEEDKLFALSLLYRNPVEYNMLVQKFTLPSDKTLHKFVARIKNAEMGAKT